MPMTLTYDPVLSRVRLSATDVSVLNTNPYFETDASGWAPGGGTFVRSTAQSHEGAASGLLTPSGVAANTQAESTNVPVTVGLSYQASAWVRCNTARNVDIGIFWFTSGGAFISTSSANNAVAATTWTLLSGTFVPPATAVFGRVMVRMTGTPPASHLLYIDEAKLENAAATVTATVERSTDGTRWTTVRGGADMKVVNNAVALDDYEFTADVPNTYRVTARSAPGLSAAVVEDFEDSSLAVTITGGWARASGDQHNGAWAFKSAVIGHSATSDAVVTVPAGAQTMQFWYRVSSEKDFDFFRVLIGGVERLAVSGETVWTLSPTFTVTPGQAVTLRYAKDSTVVAGKDAAFVDDIVFKGASAVVTNTLTVPVTPSLAGRVWIKSVSQPFLNRPVIIIDYSDVSRPARAGVFDVVGRSFPVAVSDVRGSRRWTLEVLTETPAEADDFDLVLASGDLLYVHVPAGSPVPGGYVVVGDTSARRAARYSQRRVFSLPCTEVAAPGPDVIGATLNWQSVLNRHSTWADVLAANVTWSGLLGGVGSPRDVIVP